MTSTRRSFLGSAAFSSVALAQSGSSTRGSGAAVPDRRVFFMGDGVILSPVEQARLLVKIAEEHGDVADTYLKGGAVEELEQRFAKLLGKERALFLPTGTLANHMAVRELSRQAGEKRRVIVQQESHLYCDEGDCAQLLSGLNLVPLAPGRATIKLDEVAAVVERSSGPPFPAPVGAISIESPVRRSSGEVFDFEEMKKICAYCKSKQIGTHLDGARVFLASGYTGISPAQYAALFDTVYVSMYKYFNAPFGAVLAGPAALIDSVANLRHQFGSLVYHGWQTAAIALHYFDGFTERYQAAVRNGETLFKLFAATGKIQVERVANGSNIAAIKLGSGTTDTLQQKLAAAGIMIRGAKNAVQTNLQINETLLRRSPEEIAQEFQRALA
jgi:threonine aldolase